MRFQIISIIKLDDGTVVSATEHTSDYDVAVSITRSRSFRTEFRMLRVLPSGEGGGV